MRTVRLINFGVGARDRVTAKLITSSRAERCPWGRSPLKRRQGTPYSVSSISRFPLRSAGHLALTYGKKRSIHGCQIFCDVRPLRVPLDHPDRRPREPGKARASQDQKARSTSRPLAPTHIEFLNQHGSQEGSGIQRHPTWSGIHCCARIRFRYNYPIIDESSRSDTPIGRTVQIQDKRQSRTCSRDVTHQPRGSLDPQFTINHLFVGGRESLSEKYSSGEVSPLRSKENSVLRSKILPGPGWRDWG